MIAKTTQQKCYTMFLLVGILLQFACDRDVYTFLEMYILSCLCCSGVL